MPHYQDGTPAQVGDIVKGQGYNVKHEVIGKVLDIKEETSCNLTLACISQDSPVYIGDGKKTCGWKVDPTIEYGECAKFIKIAAFLLAMVFMAPGARAQTFQHVSLSPSNLQGELFIGMMKTNAGIGQVTELPVFYRNASASDPWYLPSVSPLAMGGSVGNGYAALNLGPIVDVGPQIISGIEYGVGVFSANAKTSVTNFFNCSASATACAALSTGVLLNATIEENGNISNTFHALFRHPVGFFVGPSIMFGGPKPIGS